MFRKILVAAAAASLLGGCNSPGARTETWADVTAPAMAAAGRAGRPGPERAAQEAHYRARLARANECVTSAAAGFALRSAESVDLIADVAMTKCSPDVEVLVADRERAYSDCTSGIPRQAYERVLRRDALAAVLTARSAPAAVPAARPKRQESRPNATI